jgi:hypothetical protein
LQAGGGIFMSKTGDTSKSGADSLKKQAVTVLHSDKDLAKKLLTQARQVYINLNDKVNVVDVNAQLYLLEHS